MPNAELLYTLGNLELPMQFPLEFDNTADYYVTFWVHATANRPSASFVAKVEYGPQGFALRTNSASASVSIPLVFLTYTEVRLNKSAFLAATAPPQPGDVGVATILNYTDLDLPVLGATLNYYSR